MSSETYMTLPAPKPLKLPRKIKVVIAVMVIASLMGLVSLASKTKPTPVQSGPQYVGFATLVADNYVAGHVLDVPMAPGLSSTLGRISALATGSLTQSLSVKSQTASASTVQPLPVANTVFYSATDHRVGKTTVETDTFLLEYDDGSVAALDVVVAGTASGPELAALPALLPSPDHSSSAFSAGAPVPVASLDVPLSAGLQFQVNQWAQAYAGDNETALYQVTGDSLSRTYPGIGGLKVVGTPTIAYATQDGPKRPARLVVTVDLTLESTSKSSVVEQASYDLLITNLGHKYPNVVAWGPAGSGSALTPYENAR